MKISNVELNPAQEAAALQLLEAFFAAWPYFPSDAKRRVLAEAEKKARGCGLDPVNATLPVHFLIGEFEAPQFTG
jgi:hypothetical protein